MKRKLFSVKNEQIVQLDSEESFQNVLFDNIICDMVIKKNADNEKPLIKKNFLLLKVLIILKLEGFEKFTFHCDT